MTAGKSTQIGFNVEGRRAELKELDPVWSRVREEAEVQVQAEPLLASLIHATVLSHASLESALSYTLAHKLANEDMRSMALRAVFDEAFGDDPRIAHAVRADVVAVFDRDPACAAYLDPLLYFKGFQALQSYRAAHWLWKRGRRALARYLQSRISETFGVDIHPAARIGRGIMIDHATGVVIGETAVVGDDCSLLHGVTLGGTGKEAGDRHPKIGRGVLIGAGASVLGNIRVGHCSRVASGSVVLADVPPNSTVAGVPARVVGRSGCAEPARAMDQSIPVDEPDYSI
ncbi:MAG: serine O-acetyltransferase [Alphaproteobacteria bacterium]|nr:serine O-acetyltransferase [Alphaproteobacteria bacterium]MDX5370076.1 serine O-acetyltransferase [Alphaproteobacteria bacterium]MDX5464649.1 serine O-acetyltransferase [Alphaproteobacteria bacterium]